MTEQKDKFLKRLWLKIKHPFMHKKILKVDLRRSKMTEQNRDDLEKYAREGCLKCQYYVCIGYAYGSFGFHQEPNKLKKLAKEGWEAALNFLSEGYVKGEYGFSQDLDKALELAEKGWRFAQNYLEELETLKGNKSE
jgi:hypothetical protein